MTTDKISTVLSAAAGITFNDGPLSYQVLTNNPNTVTVTGWAGTPQQILTIPATVSDGQTTYTVIAISDNAFRGDTTLTTLNLPPEGSLAIIGDYAFAGTGLTGTLIIPKGVISIGDDAFFGTKISGTLNIPSSVAYIGASAFWGLSNITKLVLSETDSLIIGNSAFIGTGLTGPLNIPEGVISIGDNAFSDTKISGTLDIPSSVAYIGKYAFYGLSNITKLVLSETDSLIIEDYAFTSTGLTGPLNIPEGVISIGNNAFSDTKISGDLLIPRSVTFIGAYAFSNATIRILAITSENLTIGDSAFANHLNLIHVSFPNEGNIIINNSAFNNTGLTSTLDKPFKIPQSVKSIGDYAFYGCNRLEALDLSAYSGTIGDAAFSNCSKLSQITFGQIMAPDLGAYVFSSCAEKGILEYPAGAEGYDSATFAGGRLGGWTFKSYETSTIVRFSPFLLDLGSCGLGYNPQPVKVLITNVGENATGPFNLVWQGNADQYFKLSVQTIPNIVPGGSFELTVTPKVGLPVGTYEGIVEAEGTGVTTTIKSKSTFVVSVASAPQDLSALSQNGAVTLNWSAPKDNGANVTAYELSINNGTYLNIGNNLSYTVEGLENGTSYTFKVRAAVNDAKGLDATIVATPYALSFADSYAYEIPAGNVNTTINEINLALGIYGGSAPYSFSKASGPDWLTVSASGTITGTRPATVQEATVLSIRVTDSADPAKEMIVYLSVGAVLSNAVITSVEIFPSTVVIIPQGGNLQFYAKVNGIGDYDSGVKWYLYEGSGSSESTSLSANGLFTVGSDELFSSFIITAVAKGDPSKSTGVYVSVIELSNGLQFAVTPLSLIEDYLSYDLPATIVGKTIAPLDLSRSVYGGIWPYKFSATNLPTGITISESGIISGTPTTASAARTATIKVTDALNCTKQITINFGAIYQVNINSASIEETTHQALAETVGTVRITNLDLNFNYQWYYYTAADNVPQAAGNTSEMKITKGMATGEYFYFCKITADDFPPVYSETMKVTVTDWPSPPQNLSAAPGNGQITFTWDAPADNGGAEITKYQYSVSNDVTIGDSIWKDIPDSNKETTTYTITDLRNAVNYTFSIRAYNGTDFSDDYQEHVARVTATPSTLAFVDSDDYNIPDGTINTAISKINVAVSVSGGMSPYTFSKVSGPDWLIVSADGTITGTRPNTVQAATTATIKVTDINNSKTIEITVGAVTLPPDTTAPTGNIVMGDNNWNTLSTNIPFTIFVKEAQVTITATDDRDENVTIHYYLHNGISALTSAQLKDVSWNDYTEPLTLNSEGQVIIYSKLTDNAGNTTYLSSEGIIIDKTPPAFSGAEDNQTYTTSTTITVSDDHLQSVLLNEEEQSIDDSSTSYILTLNTNGTHTIKAKDKAGNEAAITVTIQIPPNLTKIESLEAIEVENGTSLEDIKLPDQVTIVTSSGNMSAVVAWDSSVTDPTYDSSKTEAQTFTISGKVALPNGVTNTDDIPLEVKISVTVAAKVVVTVSKVEISTMPTKTTYTEGEVLDLTGLQVKLSYSDGSSKIFVLTEFANENIITDPVNGTKLSVTNTKVSVSAGSKSASFDITVNAMPTVETPTFSPAGETYTSTQEVTLSSKTEEATIYYTTNGTEPTTSSTEYTGPITVSSITTIKAIAVKDGMKDSAVASATYTIQSPPPAGKAPSFTQHPSNQAVTENQTATFTVIATGDPTPTYQWQVNKGNAWEDITGATDASYTTPATTANMNGWQYRCVATNNVDEAFSNEVTLTVNAFVTYEITNGAGAEWEIGSADNLIFKAEGDFIKFTSVMVDDQTLNDDQYTAQSGSTIITLNAVYLRTLNVGAHTLKINYADGSAETTFTIKEQLKHIITATAGEGGSISPLGEVTVESGKDQTFTITANSNYHINEILVDGKSVTVNSTYTFENVAKDHTIHVSFTYTGSSGPSTPPVKPPVDPEPEPEPEPVIPDENGNAEIKVDEKKVEELLEQAVNNDSKALELLKPEQITDDLTSVSLPKADLATISEKIAEHETINSVSITTSTGTIVVEQEVLADILESTEAETVSFAVNDAKDKLTEEQKQAVGNNPVFEINIHADDQKVTSFNGKTITISLPYELKEGEDPNNIVIYHLKDDGTVERMNGYYDKESKQFIFETNHLSMFFIAYEAAEPVTPDDNKNDNIIYYAIAAIVVIILIIALAYYFLQKKQ
ncbi:leucine-rich repeat protein [Candidatus Methanomassiliicoccus intestinalis]|uniref:leucine-rich repeat protein n=1 Tax=Candidatus Methanomassiliicoccus intestinalis TaxID=1406512 RepID=UPI0037DCD9E0